MSKPKRSVIVIGAGMGGLVAATHLAQRGHRVMVVEKNSRPGGRCGQFQRQGHTFDTGPTLLVMPGLYEAEFDALGASMWGLLELMPVDPSYHLIFDDGSQLALTSDQQAMQAQLESFQPGSYAHYLDYMREASHHYDVAVKHLVYPDFRKAGDFFKPSMLPVLKQVHPLSLHYDRMRQYFDEPRLKAAFTFQDVYMGLSPYEAPATFSMMSYTEQAHGVYYPRGGLYALIQAVVKLAEQAGVAFAFDTAVKRIETEGGRATGLRLANGEWLPADVVLANADLPYVYRDLLPRSRASRAMKSKRYSCSTINFFWGVDKVYGQLPPHALFLADDYRGNFDALKQPCGLPANASLYVHAPTRLDPEMAPVGHDTLIAIVPVGHMGGHTRQDWRTLRDEARRQIFERLQMLGVTDLPRHIKFEASYNPASWRKRYNLVNGATHGLSHNLLQLGYFRPSNRHADYGNLYFAGASTRPGTGLPTTMISGRLAAERILDEQ